MDDRGAMVCDRDYELGQHFGGPVRFRSVQRSPAFVESYDSFRVLANACLY